MSAEKRFGWLALVLAIFVIFWGMIDAIATGRWSLGVLIFVVFVLGAAAGVLLMMLVPQREGAEIAPWQRMD